MNDNRTPVATRSPGARVARAAARFAAPLLATFLAIGAGHGTASAADFDTRIQAEYQIKCLGSTFGLTPSVRITQPLVASAKQLESISWMPWLQRWDPIRRTWTHILRSASWISIYGTNSGYNYYYTNQPRTFLFENLARGYYYRIIHVVQWSSTSELGSMPSDYHSTSGYCLL